MQIIDFDHDNTSDDENFFVTCPNCNHTAVAARWTKDRWFIKDWTGKPVHYVEDMKCFACKTNFIRVRDLSFSNLF